MNSSSDKALLLILDLIRSGIRVDARNGRIRLQTGGMEIPVSLLESIKLQKSELLKLLGDKKFAPLSPSQERLWLEQMGAGTSYKIPGLARVDGSLDTMALQKAVDIVCMRHEILRTRFPSHLGIPIQAIHPLASIPFTLHHSSHEGAAAKRMKELISQPFDLVDGPLIRVDIVQWNEQKAFLLVAMHHIISDAWSMRVLLQELTEAYSAISQGFDFHFQPLELQYSGFASWQQNFRTQRSQWEHSLTYWSDILSGYRDLDLPTDFPRPTILDDRGGVVMSRCLLHP